MRLKGASLCQLASGSCVARGLGVAARKNYSIIFKTPKNTKHKTKKLAVTAPGFLAHKPQQQRSTATGSSTARYVVCEWSWSATLKTPVLGGQK